MLTPELFAKIQDCPIGVARAWQPPIEAAMMEYGIMSTRRAAAFLARMGTESGGFSRFTENLNYSTQALVSKFGRHRISIADAERYGRNDAHPANQEMLANILYGGDWGRARLGNTEPGDGWRFRGQGPKQITGRYNFAALTLRLADRLGPKTPDFLVNPELLTQPVWGSYSAGDFWHANKLNEPAELGDIEEVVRIINGGSMGLEDTQERYLRAMELL